MPDVWALSQKGTFKPGETAPLRVFRRFLAPFPRLCYNKIP